MSTGRLNRERPGTPRRSNDTMTRYAVGGYEEFPVLHLRPVSEGPGVDLPDALFARWQHARTELDSAQREVLGYIRATAGATAIPDALRESGDYPAHEHPSDQSWHLS
jgi:hypothetical protein